MIQLKKSSLKIFDMFKNKGKECLTFYNQFQIMHHLSYVNLIQQFYQRIKIIERKGQNKKVSFPQFFN
ncbi:unnamed protein product [Paramecium sonneborni]|uniref:Uncharacterized protein n=1 Tax=Paramecium sonneborni TaxID=65129 RepID=A0A8S1RQU2_9CILI|nr:unnamed protein product [Paramecium sonneborni]